MASVTQTFVVSGSLSSNSAGAQSGQTSVQLNYNGTGHTVNELWTQANKQLSTVALTQSQNSLVINISQKHKLI